MSTFLAAGTRQWCPQCKRLQLFRRNIPTEALPVTIRCSFKDCGHSLTYSILDGENPPKFPKIDPLQKIEGDWIVEMQEESNKTWKVNENLKQISFRERAEAIAGHLAGGLECIESLKYDLEQLADIMTAQLESGWGNLTSPARMWNPARIQHFIRQPFLPLHVPSNDEFIRQRTRLLLHPAFFTPDVGINIVKQGGVFGQLITPYTQFSYPVEDWMAAVCDLPTPLKLSVRGHKIIGRDLVRCWKDIPGVTTSIDHLEDAPSVEISNSIEARCWLARLGIPPWMLLPYSTSDCYPTIRHYYESPGVKPSHCRAWKRFSEAGRMAYFTGDRVSGWEFIMTVAAFHFGYKLMIVPKAEQQEEYRGLAAEVAKEAGSNRNFQWKVVGKSEDLENIPWGSFRFIAVDYRPEMPPEILEALHQYNGRLLIIHDDPIMDLLETNWESSRFYSLVNSIHLEERQPGSQDYFNYHQAQECLVTALLKQWRS